MSENYEIETRAAYRNPSKARSYRLQHMDGFSWARLTMWRELSSAAKALRYFAVSDRDVVIDMPCGTGVAGSMLGKQSGRTLAMDISQEMMGLASDEYDPTRLMGFVQADIATMPLPDRSASGMVILGFMHRVPLEIKELTLQEAARICERFAVISFTVDTAMQRWKKHLLKALFRRHSGAPAPMRLGDIKDLAERSGFVVRRIEKVAPPVSAEVVLWLEKREA